MLFFIPLEIKEPVKICFSAEGECFDAEIVKAKAQRERGLMFKKSLPENSGMLFIFEKEDNYPFWMKNTFIPLDIIWIDKNYKIVFIKENAKPCGLGSCPFIDPGINAKYVLEINTGLAEKFNIKMGELIQVSPSL